MRKIKKIICIFLLITISLLTSCNEKYNKKWIETNKNKLISENVNYFIVDNPKWLVEAGLKNTFSIQIKKYNNDNLIIYDIGGTKLYICDIGADLYYYIETSVGDTLAYKIDSNFEKIKELSSIKYDYELINMFQSFSPSKHKIKYQGNIDNLDVISLESKDEYYELYINPNINICERFEYIDKKTNETYNVYLSELNKLKLPNEFNNIENIETISEKEFIEEINSMLAGSMYMLQLYNN